MLIAARATGLLQDHVAFWDWCHRGTELYAEIRAFAAFVQRPSMRAHCWRSLRDPDEHLARLAVVPEVIGECGELGGSARGRGRPVERLAPIADVRNLSLGPNDARAATEAPAAPRAAQRPAAAETG